MKKSLLTMFSLFLFSGGASGANKDKLEVWYSTTYDGSLTTIRFSADMPLLQEWDIHLLNLEVAKKSGARNPLFIEDVHGAQLSFGGDQKTAKRVISLLRHRFRHLPITLKAAPKGAIIARARLPASRVLFLF